MYFVIQVASRDNCKMLLENICHGNFEKLNFLKDRLIYKRSLKGKVSNNRVLDLLEMNSQLMCS